MNCIRTSYTVEIDLSKPPGEVFNKVINLAAWWPEEFIGEKIKPDAEFILKTGEGHYSKNRVIEFVPERKLTWLTIESLRKSDNFDWSGTKFIFELIPQGSNTHLKFMYDGVVLENEQDRLAQICEFCIRNSLYNLIENSETKRD
jgi:hypothetical protein